MRKIILPLIILLFATASKAQYVNIPDSNFRNFLMAKYPACFNASKQMDTTCNAVVNETAFELEPVGPSNSYISIKNFNGLQYFKSINKITVGHNLKLNYDAYFDTLKFSDTFYPASVDTFICIITIHNFNFQFPKTLKYFLIDQGSDYFNIQLPLPNTLRYFSAPISSFKISQFNFPDSLTYFFSNDGRYLASIDSFGNMPNTLKYFSCIDCYVPKLGTFSTSLEYFDMHKISFDYFRGLLSLPILPNTLQYLDCSGNENIKSLPNLPNSLKELYCYRNKKLISLPTLPNSLLNLDCSDNQITSLPILPNSLVKFNCGDNQITVLPTIPNSLLNLNCYNNQITVLPALPNTLVSLGCGNNKITNIPSLPDSLKSFSCSFNSLKILPSLPINLKYLDCGYNKSLLILPILPNKLEKLDCAYDSLLGLPSLPNSLEDLNCKGNYLTSLPALPFLLKSLSCEYNKITCLPQLPSTLMSLYIEANSIKCLPNIPNGCMIWNYDSLSYNIVLPLCNPTNNPNHCQSFPVMSGVVYYDNNSNGVKDATELYRANVQVQLSNGKYTFTNKNGYYEIGADSIGAYTVTINNPNLYNALPQTISYNFSSYDTLVANSIALQPNTVKDSLSLNITAINWQARPGFSFPYWVSYENVGTTTISPTIRFNYDSAKMIYDSSSTSVVATSNNLSLNVGSIVPGSVNSFVAYFRVKSTVPIGDSVVVTATATNADNVKLVSDVGGSFDPNDKQATPVLTPTQVALGKYIDYTIRFQNTGNDTAFTVVIADTLSSNLQANTLQMVVSSHNCKTTVAGNIVYFEFMNIKLADSVVNEKASHGFVSFKIKPKATLTNGNTVSNKAFIYFDYNAAVATNTAITQIKNSLLPVRITNYELRMTNEKQIQNIWTTSNEINASHFVIQRSEDGRVFKSVGTVAAKGNGTYSFLDGVNSLLPSPLGEGLGVRLYYRLQVVDKDGSYSFSEIKQIRLNQLTDKQINIYPNPATAMVSIDCNNAKQISIVDYLGRTIKQFNNVTAHQTINAKQFNKGIYVVKVLMNNGEIKTEKLVVE